MACLYDAYTYYPLVKLQFAVWQAFKMHEGKVEYYLFGGGMKHGGICFKSIQTGAVGQAELVYSKIEECKGERKWYVMCREGTWEPSPGTKVHTSEHAWHVSTVLYMCHQFSGYFKTYHALFNDCNSWKNNIVEHMRSNGPGNIKMVNSLEELIHRAKEDLGLHLEVSTKPLPMIYENEQEN